MNIHNAGLSTYKHARLDRGGSWVWHPVTDTAPNLSLKVQWKFSFICKITTFEFWWLQIILLRHFRPPVSRSIYTMVVVLVLVVDEEEFGILARDREANVSIFCSLSRMLASQLDTPKEEGLSEGGTNNNDDDDNNNNNNKGSTDFSHKRVTNLLWCSTTQQALHKNLGKRRRGNCLNCFDQRVLPSLAC